MLLAALSRSYSARAEYLAHRRQTARDMPRAAAAAWRRTDGIIIKQSMRNMFSFLLRAAAATSCCVACARQRATRRRALRALVAAARIFRTARWFAYLRWRSVCAYGALLLPAAIVRAHQRQNRRTLALRAAPARIDGRTWTTGERKAIM